MPKFIVSFGFRHGGPNSADCDVIDIRKWFTRNPFHDRKLRHLRGTDPEIQADIQLTPGFAQSYNELFTRVRQSTADVVWLGCTGGHHRSVYLAELISKALSCKCIHRDIDRP